MGEKKKGGGAERSVATSNIARLVADQLNSDGREPSQITIQRVTDGLFSVQVSVHGEQDDEAFFVSVKGE